LLGAGGEMGGLFHNTFWRYIKTIAMAIRASGCAFSHDRFAPFANLVVVRRGYDLLGASRAIGKVLGI